MQAANRKTALQALKILSKENEPERFSACAQVAQTGKVSNGILIRERWNDLEEVRRLTKYIKFPRTVFH